MKMIAKSLLTISMLTCASLAFAMPDIAGTYQCKGQSILDYQGDRETSTINNESLIVTAKTSGISLSGMETEDIAEILIGEDQTVLPCKNSSTTNRSGKRIAICNQKQLSYEASESSENAITTVKVVLTKVSTSGLKLNFDMNQRGHGMRQQLIVKCIKL